MAKSSRKDSGFEEAPQAEITGAPLTGSISDWAEQIAEEAAKPQPKTKKIQQRSSAPTKTARGTSMGGAATAKERAAAGLNPVAGLDISLEDADSLSTSGVTATVDALSAPDRVRQPAAQERRAVGAAPPARPEKSEGGIPFKIVSDFEPPATSRPRSRSSSPASRSNERTQVLLGVTGSGKTFTMAQVIEETQRPALILAPNKTLAAQLYGEFKSFFPDNAVEYFVSYYDYYQPEAYVPRTDTYHREGILDQRADRPHAPRGDARAARARRRDHRRLGVLHLRYRLGRDLHGDDLRAEGRRAASTSAQLLADLVALQYKRNDVEFRPRHVPRARRHDRDLPGPSGGPRLAHLAVRRRDRERSPSSIR